MFDYCDNDCANCTNCTCIVDEKNEKRRPQISGSSRRRGVKIEFSSYESRKRFEEDYTRGFDY